MGPFFGDPGISTFFSIGFTSGFFATTFFPPKFFSTGFVTFCKDHSKEVQVGKQKLAWAASSTASGGSLSLEGSAC
jgi:hypothetical protein